MNFDIPPKDVPFGSLGVGVGPDGQPLEDGRPSRHPPKRASFAFPNNPKPKAIEFPFLEPSEEAERIGKLFVYNCSNCILAEEFSNCSFCVTVHTEAHLHHGAGNIMGKIRVGRQKLIFPGWLIELNDEQV